MATPPPTPTNPPSATRLAIADEPAATTLQLVAPMLQSFRQDGYHAALARMAA
jgi:hypothetical protein